MLLQFTHFSFLFFLFALLHPSYAHSGVSPQLGVDGKSKRSDVKRPSQNQPCGSGVNIASTLDTSTAVPASANGDVKVTVVSFNPGADGSRQVTAQVDPTGTGNLKSFVKMTISVNGDPAPKSTGSESVVAQLPTGTKCTGGTKKNKCLAQFVTTSGFGNCVVISQGSGAAAGNTSSVARAADPVVGIDISGRGVDVSVRADEKKSGGKNDGGKKKEKKGGQKKDKKGGQKKDKKGGQKKEKKGGKKQEKKGGEKRQAGTRAPRALLVDLVEE